MYYLFFDTETTGKPKNYKAPMSDVDNYPRLVQLGYIVMRDDVTIEQQEFVIRPDGFEIPEDASKIHGITNEKAIHEGVLIKNVIERLRHWIVWADVVAGHNVEFDMNVVGAEFIRNGFPNPFANKKMICTMKSSTNYCKLEGMYGYKYPRLTELYLKLFGEELPQTHTALDDIKHTAKCYFELERLGIIK